MQAVPVLAIRNKILGALLKHARLRTGRLADEYAEVFGCSVEDILAWEGGAKPITLSELEVWAYVSGVPLSFFWDENALPPRRELKQPVRAVMQIRLGLCKMSRRPSASRPNALRSAKRGKPNSRSPSWNLPLRPAACPLPTSLTKSCSRSVKKSGGCAI